MNKFLPMGYSRVLLLVAVLIASLLRSDAAGASLTKLRRCLEAMVDSTPIPTKTVGKSTSVAVGAILFFRREEMWGGASFRMSDFYPELFRSVMISPENREKSTYSQWIREFDTQGSIKQLADALSLSDKQKADLSSVAKKCRAQCEEIIKSFTDGPIQVRAQDLWENSRKKVNAILTDEQKTKLDAKIAEWKKKYDK